MFFIVQEDNVRLVSINVMGNTIGKEELSKLQITMKSHSTLQSLCGISASDTEADLSGLGMDAADAAILAEDIYENAFALSSLDLSQNALLTKEAGASLGSMLKNTTTLKVLNLAGPEDPRDDTTPFRMKDGPGFAFEIASGLEANANNALTSLNLANNRIGADGAKCVAEALRKWYVGWFCFVFCIFSFIFFSTAMSDLNLSGNSLNSEGVKHIAEVVPEWCVAACPPFHHLLSTSLY